MTDTSMTDLATHMTRDAPRTLPALEIRLLQPGDAISPVTALIRRAYQKLGEMDLQYTGTWQDDRVTAERASRGECYLAFLHNSLVGTITLEPKPCTSKGSAWYTSKGVASFHQFAVEPDQQSQGIGSTMLDFVEKRAAQEGATELALDTAQPALHLIRYYEARGYRCIETVQWEGKNYRSIIMSKNIGKSS